MQTVLLVVHLMVVIALVGVVLLQRSEGGALGIGGGGGFMTSRGTANVLTRATAILATIFFVTSIALSVLPRFFGGPTSILDTVPGAAAPTGGADAPVGSGSGGVLDDLNKIKQQRQPDAPAAPAPGPQVPAAPGTSGEAAPGAGAPATLQDVPVIGDTPAADAPIEVPAAPLTPATPDAPEVPAAPLTPATPDAPAETPAAPLTPAAPETPAAPLAPATPDAVAPAAPAAPAQ